LQDGLREYKLQKKSALKRETRNVKNHKTNMQIWKLILKAIPATGRGGL
jgi:hypothetical protein